MGTETSPIPGTLDNNLSFKARGLEKNVTVRAVTGHAGFNGAPFLCYREDVNHVLSLGPMDSYNCIEQ